MKKVIACVMLPIVFVALFGSCQATPEKSAADPVPAKEPHVVISKSRTILVAGKPTPIPAIPKRLKDLGISSETPVVVQAHGEVPHKILVDVLSELNSAGYTKVSFTVPK